MPVAEIRGTGKSTVDKPEMVKACLVPWYTISPSPDVNRACTHLAASSSQTMAPGDSRSAGLALHVAAPNAATNCFGSNKSSGLFMEATLHRQLPLRRSKRHRFVGERLEALYSQQLSDVAPQLAHHFEEGADWERAARYLQMASGAARRRYARRETVAMLQRALELAGKLPAVRSAAIENALLEDLATMTAASFETVDRAVESYETMAARVWPLLSTMDERLG
jgi:hypothetical protein